MDYEIKIFDLKQQEAELELILEITSNINSNYYFGKDAFSLDFYVDSKTLLPITLDSSVVSISQLKGISDGNIKNLKSGERYKIHLKFSLPKGFIEKKNITSLHEYSEKINVNLKYRPITDNKRINAKYFSIPLALRKD